MPPSTFQKRKLPFGGLQRRVRARREDVEPELEDYSEEERASEDDGSEDLSDQEGRVLDDESESASGSEDDDDDDDGEEEDPSSVVAQVSFGALAKAQASMPDIRRKKGRKISSSHNEDEDEQGQKEEEKDSRHPQKPDSKSSKPPKPTRSSKHAPMEMSSKRQVSRKREVVSMNKVAPRDPRFSAASGAEMDEARARKAYAFLDEYRDSEMAQLKVAVKKTKSAAEKEELARALKSMQSRKEAQARRDAEREVLAQHRQKEKELVAQGKKPFYLKKSEQKKQLLMDRFAGMKKKQVDRTIERRRKKLTARERKSMPVARRGATT
ncbi:hypothetical protein F5Y08DRAFT_301088 [Xylaria arbuscula]|nr:hypothetical protein F5Y08DRAFT_301088 [Xylaria arbuscula]